MKKLFNRFMYRIGYAPVSGEYGDAIAFVKMRSGVKSLVITSRYDKYEQSVADVSRIKTRSMPLAFVESICPYIVYHEEEVDYGFTEITATLKVLAK